MPNLVSLTHPSLQILDKTQRGYFQFLDFWSIPYKCNSRTSNDIDMKLGAVTKLDKRNKMMSKELDDYIMLANCDVIFSIYR